LASRLFVVSGDVLRGGDERGWDRGVETWCGRRVTRHVAFCVLQDFEGPARVLRGVEAPSFLEELRRLGATEEKVEEVRVATARWSGPSPISSEEVTDAADESGSP
jgi:hypothetical protein